MLPDDVGIDFGEEAAARREAQGLEEGKEASQGPARLSLPDYARDHDGPGDGPGRALV